MRRLLPGQGRNVALKPTVERSKHVEGVAVPHTYLTEPHTTLTLAGQRG